ncbi:MAG: GDP-fucose synthetase [Desulfobacterales bacterium C00003060]|nr:MAG: GDP-fucose synthetase [Desulfobacterales bacterium C00003060]
MELDSKIFVAGHRGLVGSAICLRLKKKGYTNIIRRTHIELDLERQAQVESFFQEQRPDYVFLGAAKVGGIWANNSFPAEFIYSNIMVQTNVIHSAYRTGVKKLLFLGSSCIYPKHCPQPMKEEYLLTDTLEPTNEPYAVAKIAGIKMCQSYNRQYDTNFISVMPTNLYGPNDNFDLETSHVIPALIRKFHEAKVKSYPSVTIWGTGIPKREFLHVDDLADACIFLVNHYDESDIINVGWGEDISIAEFALSVKDIVGYPGNIEYDTEKPDGTPRKVLDVSRLRGLGWKPKISLEEGIRKTYEWYCQQGNH